MRSTRQPDEPCDSPFERVLRAFDDERVRYLLIGGQAAIIYGASQFTQDADFWVEPTERNVRALQRALAALQARPRFLPPLEVGHLKRGHGVHFIIPDRTGDFFVDLLGKPPRVRGFRSAYGEAQTILWRGLNLRVLDIYRLVQTKKTNRDQDYLTIQRLAESVFLSVRRHPGFRSRVMRWLLEESRSPRHLMAIARSWPDGRETARRAEREAARLAGQGAATRDIQAALDREKAAFQKANLDYWRPLLRELRSLRRG